jgi:DNA polymerase-3 subunit delta
MISLWTGDNEYKKQTEFVTLKSQFSDFNKTTLSNPTSEELGSVVNKTPLMANQHLVVVIDSDKLEKDKELSDKLSSVSDKTYLLFFNVKSNGNVYKAIKKNGKIIKFDNPAVKNLNSFIRDTAMESGLKFVNENAVNLFAFYVGNDEMAIRNELSKFSKNITEEDVVNTVTNHEKVDVFALITQVLKGQLDAAWASIEQYESEKQELLALTALLINHVKLLIQVKTLDKKGMKKNMVSKELKIHPYRASVLITQSRIFNQENLCKMFVMLFVADQSCKRSNSVIPLKNFILQSHLLTKH